jgi:phosphonate transport system permease protein
VNSFSLENQAAIVGRYPDLFRPDWWHRGKITTGLAAAVALFLFGIVQLDIPFHRLSDGMLRLGGFLRPRRCRLIPVHWLKR